MTPLQLHCNSISSPHAHILIQVVLNEVVIDRGAAPFLTNLEAFCDGNFVTHVQVEVPRVCV